jgi:hypothetical protein
MYATFVTVQKAIYPVLFWVTRLVINFYIVLLGYLDFIRDIYSSLPVFMNFSVFTLVMYETAISNATKMYTKAVIE